jgi:hypothetical protein
VVVVPPVVLPAIVVIVIVSISISISVVMVVVVVVLPLLGRRRRHVSAVVAVVGGRGLARSVLAMPRGGRSDLLCGRGGRLPNGRSLSIEHGGLSTVVDPSTVWVPVVPAIVDEIDGASLVVVVRVTMDMRGDVRRFDVRRLYFRRRVAAAERQS